MVAHAATLGAMSHSGESPPPVTTGTRVAFVGALILLGTLLVVGARSAELPADSRIGGRVELVELIRAEEARVDALAGRVEELSLQVAAYRDAGRPGQAEAAAVQEQLDALAPAAGMAPAQGPGVVASLNDSGSRPAPGEDPNNYVIHEQDLQAVINALWSGGAEAMSVNDQRILATTAIRCVGNTLLLHGRVYSPPYVVAAVGDPVQLEAALQRDPVVQRFTEAAAAYELGWSVEVAATIPLPHYQGPAAMQVARPVGDGVAG